MKYEEMISFANDNKVLEVHYNRGNLKRVFAKKNIDCFMVLKVNGKVIKTSQVLDMYYDNDRFNKFVMEVFNFIFTKFQSNRVLNEVFRDLTYFNKDGIELADSKEFKYFVYEKNNLRLKDFLLYTSPTKEDLFKYAIMTFPTSKTNLYFKIEKETSDFIVPGEIRFKDYDTRVVNLNENYTTDKMYAFNRLTTYLRDGVNVHLNDEQYQRAILFQNLLTELKFIDVSNVKHTKDIVIEEILNVLQSSEYNMIVD